MAAIKNVKYLNKECIYQYFHNPNKAFLEGFIVDENPIFCPRNCESGVYIKIFKVPVNSRVNEIYAGISVGSVEKQLQHTASQ